jgi:hypothetical protein
VGVKVTLSGDGGGLSVLTNGFGDFEFEGLKDNVDYTVKVEAVGYKAKSVKARTAKDINLGEIVLKK